MTDKNKEHAIKYFTIATFGQHIKTPDRSDFKTFINETPL